MSTDSESFVTLFGPLGNQCNSLHGGCGEPVYRVRSVYVTEKGTPRSQLSGIFRDLLAIFFVVFHRRTVSL
jgi:hypothetical protein